MEHTLPYSTSSCQAYALPHCQQSIPCGNLLDIPDVLVIVRTVCMESIGSHTTLMSTAFIKDFHDKSQGNF